MPYKLQEYNFLFTYNKSKTDLKDFNKKDSMGGIYQNLLHDEFPSVVIDLDSAIITEEISDQNNIYTFFDYYNQYIKHTFISSSSIPHMIIDMGGSFTNLDGINYSKELQDYLNEKGLEIYFWELPILEFSEERANLKGICEFHLPEFVDTKIRYHIMQKQFQHYKHNIVGFENDQINFENLYFIEFEKIYEFTNRNNLQNVTILTGFYNVSKFIKKQYPKFKFKTRDLCLASFGRKDNKITTTSYFPDKKIIMDQNFKFKFISTNKRYEGYRQLVAAYLYNKSSLISFHPNLVSFDIRINGRKIKGSSWKFYWKDINNRIWFDINLFKKTLPDVFFKNIELLNRVDYLSIDKNRNEKNFPAWISLNHCNEDSEIPLNNYKDCFCSITTESTFSQPFAHFLDKVLNVIKSCRPFIIVAPPYTLKYIRLMGFKTFDRWWDESYDEEENHQKRLLKIFATIEFIERKSMDELKMVHEEMFQILVDNYHNLGSLKSGKIID